MNNTLARRPPSRHTNPFSTCWVHPEAQKYLETGVSIQRIVQRLQKLKWRGAIVGPHGVGKTTLLHTLLPKIEFVGKRCVLVEIRNGKSSQAMAAVRELTLDSETVLCIDGYEQLRWWQRVTVEWYCSRIETGLIVTSHRSTRLTTALRLRPSMELALALVHRLSIESDSPISDQDVRRAFNTCNGNLRDMLMDLYDRYELNRRG